MHILVKNNSMTRCYNLIRQAITYMKNSLACYIFLSYVAHHHGNKMTKCIKHFLHICLLAIFRQWIHGFSLPPNFIPPLPLDNMKVFHTVTFFYSLPTFIWYYFLPYHYSLLNVSIFGKESDKNNEGKPTLYRPGLLQMTTCSFKGYVKSIQTYTKIIYYLFS